MVSTESVNSYGYRILTDGIDTEQYMKNPVVLYMHNRAWSRGNEVIGRVVSLKKENAKLLAEVEFDEADEFAKQIAGKVERGFIKMCSLGADVIETSSEAQYLAEGQTRETVTKCKMVELSIVDIGGNNEALKLSRNGQQTEIKLVNQKEDMSVFKTLALALGMGADTSEAVLLQRVNELQSAKNTAENEVKEWKDKFAALQKTEAEKIVGKAVKLGLIPEGLQGTILLSFEQDFEGQSAKLSQAILEKETEKEKENRQTTVKTAVELSKSSASPSVATNETFDYLQKHNVLELKRIQSEEPEKYAQLAKDYARGVRHQS